MRRKRSRVATLLRRILAGYAVLALLFALFVLVVAPSRAPFRSSDGAGAAKIFADPAQSWSAFNQGTATQQPVWGADEFLAAVAHAGGGQVVRMSGTATYLDDAAVTAVIKDSNVLVVVTPPTPLGAVETTRIRDNTVQQAWATPKKLQLIMVHGQEVYLPGSGIKGQDLLIRTTPPSGLPMREGMRTGAATSTVVRTAQRFLAYLRGEKDATIPNPAGSAAWTAADLALTGTRAPTTAELGPVTQALDHADLYVDPSITPAPAYDQAWAAVGQGKPVKVVLLPYAQPTTAPIDWTTPLSQRYPGDVVLVMTGKWIESAGTDRQTMIDAITQTDGLGGFSFAASAPAYALILDWVTGIDSSALATQAFDRPLPALPGTGFPTWLAYLLLATSVLVALGFGGAALVERHHAHRVAVPREVWRDSVFGGLTGAYVALSSAPFLGRGGPGSPRRRSDAWTTRTRISSGSGVRTWPRRTPGPRIGPARPGPTSTPPPAPCAGPT